MRGNFERNIRTFLAAALILNGCGDPEAYVDEEDFRTDSPSVVQSPTEQVPDPSSNPSGKPSQTPISNLPQQTTVVGGTTHMPMSSPIVTVIEAPAKPPRVVVFAFGQGQKFSTLRNKKGEGNEIYTSLEVGQNDIVEFRPELLVREIRRDSEGRVTRIDNEVCTKTTDVCVANEPVMERRCDDQCRVCMKCHPFPPSCYPWRCCDNVCQDVKVGERCTKTEQRCTQRENQWREITSYSGMGEPQLTKNLLPMSEATLLSNGIKLKFSYNGPNNAPPLTCPLSSLKAKSDHEKFTFVASNSPECPLSLEMSKSSTAVLSIISELASPTNFLQGSQVKTWDGRLLEQPVNASFSPLIELSGSITVRESKSK